MVKLNEKFLSDFVAPHEIEYMRPFASAAHDMLVNGTGAGNDFLGWVKLPVDYDKEGSCRIQ